MDSLPVDLAFYDRRVSITYILFVDHYSSIKQAKPFSQYVISSVLVLMSSAIFDSRSHLTHLTHSPQSLSIDNSAYHHMLEYHSYRTIHTPITIGECTLLFYDEGM
eukprot:GHVN01064554.1.p1 GENE.GHVN01064554.1~~GHVN01064554.1.p1  ORF type:complete len:106 (+),score=12.65 GHVN01064554.1:287-604(+)